MPFARTLLLVAVFVGSVIADTEYVMKTDFNGDESIVRHYTRGKDMRTEDIAMPGNRQHVTISNFKRRAMYQVNERARQYTEMQGPDFVAELAALITRSPRVHASGKTVNIYYDTIDTGERRQMFGFSAHHMIFHERHVAEPGACSGDSEVDRDGWYALPGSSPAQQVYTLRVEMTCGDTVVKHGKFINPGLPLQEKTTTRYSNSAGPAHVSSAIREILDFSTEPLDERLFEIPKGFQRVEEASWTNHLAYDWSQLERAFSSWFD